MKTIEFFREELKEFHKGFLAAVKDLSAEQLHFRPLNAGNSIAFTFWHYVRTEDIMMQVFLQKKKPIWNTEGWDRKFGMDPRSQGTGMTADQAAGVRIADPAGFRQYAEKVFQTSEAFLETLTEESLDGAGEYPVVGKKNVRQVIGGLVLQHGAGHLGEIWYVKGLQGMKGSPV